MLVWASLLAFSVQAENKSLIVASIKPLAMLQADLGLGWQEPIVPDGITPHDFSLRASHIKRINAAQLVIWLGPEIEPYLAKIMARKAAYQQIILPPYTHAEDAQNQHHKESKGDDEHQHYGKHQHKHHHGADLHPWTSPVYMQRAMAQVAEAINTLLPQYAHTVKANEQRQQQQLAAQMQQWQDYFASHKVSYLVYHDALQPYETAMGLGTSNMGSFADAAGSQFGLKNLRQLQLAIVQQKVACVLVDNEANLALIKKIAGQQLPQVTLDLLAWQLRPGTNNLHRYFAQLGQAVQQCQ
ncbi:MAG: zinc ABC transporter substrate-binding protein [Gammaproteobacteria bacterium]|nr:zinc ABC transporter substrate-binding protein [Gammaproteobacteria bacterium]